MKLTSYVYNSGYRIRTGGGLNGILVHYTHTFSQTHITWTSSAPKTLVYHAGNLGRFCSYYALRHLGENIIGVLDKGLCQGS